MRQLNRKQIAALIFEAERKSKGDSQSWAEFHKRWTRTKMRLEFPSGEITNPAIAGYLFAWRMTNELQLGLPITGKEQFSAQGLEGKVAVETDALTAVLAYRELPERRRALYRL